MHITSINNKSFVTLERNAGGGGYQSFRMAVHADIGRGTFSGQNEDLHFLNLRAFTEAFDAFILDRSRSPRLEGTYDTWVAFSGLSTTVLCEYSLGEAFSGVKTIWLRQSGAFEVDQGRLLEYLAGFRALGAEA
jgi:hypothetical protein